MFNTLTYYVELEMKISGTHTSAALLLRMLLLAGIKGYEGDQCQRRGVPRAVHVVPPGSDITLSCGSQITVYSNSVAHFGGGISNTVTDGLRQLSSTSTAPEETTETRLRYNSSSHTPQTAGWVKWTCNGRPLPRGKGDEILQIVSPQAPHSGNYSCYRGGALQSSVRIVVAAPLEQPSLSCFRKSLTSNIRCEWLPKQPIIPTPHCYIIIQQGILGNFTMRNCSYSVSHTRCWCVLEAKLIPIGEAYWASLCVSNMAGSSSSPMIEIHSQNILKPGPPLNVSVRGVEDNRHRLIVSWKYPSAWRADFYRLKFHLKYYHILHGETTQVQEVFTSRLSHVISDAVPRSYYQVQIRAMEEYDLGQWSDWSATVSGNTWTGPDPTPRGCETLSHCPWLSEGSGMSVNYAECVPPCTTVHSMTEVPSSRSSLLLGLSWVLGACILLLLTGLAIFILRNRLWFGSKLQKLRSTSSSHPSSPPPSPSPRGEDSPLVCPLPPPPLNLTLEQEKGEGIHLNNMGYFMVQSE